MASRGRPPKPTALLKLQGTFRKHRHANRKDDIVALPELRGLPPPIDMPPAQAEIWTDILSRTPPGMAARLDYELFRRYVELLDRYHRARDAQAELDRNNKLPLLIETPQGLQISPYVREMDKLVLLLTRLQHELGYTPAGRARASWSDADEAELNETWGELRKPLRIVTGGRRD
jgi:hypothetical protein